MVPMRGDAGRNIVNPLLARVHRELVFELADGFFGFDLFGTQFGILAQVAGGGKGLFVKPVALGEKRVEDGRFSLDVEYFVPLFDDLMKNLNERDAVDADTQTVAHLRSIGLVQAAEPLKFVQPDCEDVVEGRFIDIVDDRLDEMVAQPLAVVPRNDERFGNSGARNREETPAPRRQTAGDDEPGFLLEAAGA